METLRRLPNWFANLKTTFEDYRSVPFTWGRADCATFAADCIRATTGVDVMGTWRGSYTSAATAEGRLRGRGFTSLREAVADALSAHGCPPVEPEAARNGDVGITADDVVCVRFRGMWLARKRADTWHEAKPVAAWSIGLC